MAVVPLGRHQFAVPSQQRVWRDEGFKLIQHLAPECLRFSGESTAFGIGETKAPPTHALLKHAVLFLEIRNHVQLMAVYPTCEDQEKHLKWQKQWGHCRRVYRSLRHPALSRRLAARQLASPDYLDNTGSCGDSMLSPAPCRPPSRSDARTRLPGRSLVLHP